MRINLLTTDNGHGYTLLIDGSEEPLYFPVLPGDFDYSDTPLVWLRRQIAQRGDYTQNATKSIGSIDVVASDPIAQVVEAGRAAIAAMRSHDGSALRNAFETFEQYGALSDAGEMFVHLRRGMGRKWRESQLCSNCGQYYEYGATIHVLLCKHGISDREIVAAPWL